MKKNYYVNKQAQTNGDYEVHVEVCVYMPSSANQKFLGEFHTCEEAVREAKKDYTKVNGCYYCCNECHTS